MELRSINKLFILNNALRKHNKTNDIKLSLSCIFILYAVKQQCKAYNCTFSEIDKFLRKNRHTNSRTILNKWLNQFESAGLLNLNGSNPKRYNLTLAGLNFLNDLEKTIRFERVNKI